MKEPATWRQIGDSMEKHLNVPQRHEFFGFGWTFHYGDMEIHKAQADDDGFRPVTLPHDWLMDYEASGRDEKSGAMNWKYGVGIYRKEFLLDDSNRGRVIRLLFDGVYQDASVTLNGVPLGSHFYGYTPFEFDISHVVRYGEPNLLIVRVDNSAQPNTRWYSGSGITRDVWISSLPPVHVATGGTFIVTDSLENGVAALSVTTEIENSAGVDSDVDVISRIYAPDGRLLAALPARMTLGAAAGRTLLRQKLAVRDAALWSPDHPDLHHMVTEILEDGAVTDRYVTPFGIRTIRFDADRGFFLNDIPLKLHGMAIHNEAGQLGAAVPIKVWKRRFEKLKGMGCNAIRTAHNPADPLILDLMDQMGLLCMDEFFDEWTICKWSKSRGNPEFPPHGYAEYFDRLCREDMETIIRRDRNHPCVILWSVGNECEEVYTVDGWEVMKKLRDLCHSLDSTRPVTEGTNLLAHNSRYTYEKFMDYQDVRGFNWVNIWNDRAELFYEPDKIRHPHSPMVITETGGIPGSRGNYPLPERRSQESGPFSPSPYYSWPVEAGKHMRFIETRDYISGVFYWTGVDYMGEAPYPFRGGEKSPLDLAGFIRDSWYFYRSMWKREIPTVHLMPHWNPEVAEGTILPVICYTSCPSAELFLNGKSYGEKAYLYPARGIDAWPDFDLTKPWANTDDLFLSWDVPYEKGELTVLGYDREGREIARHQIRTFGEASVIRLESDSERIRADGRDIAQIEISLVDADGNPVLNAANELTVRVSGAGRLLALENGNASDHTMGSVPVRKAYCGRLLAVVLSDRDTPGDLYVEVSAKGMEKQTVKISSEGV